jgi:hypothetical protein
MMAADTLDLVVLVPGKDERETLDGLLSRHSALGIRPLDYRILDPHPRRDPGCFHEAPQDLQPFLLKAQHALVMFDREGSGQEQRSAGEIARDVEGRLRGAGWDDRARALVLDPELEIWVWSDSPHVEKVLGWGDRSPGLREWLREAGLLNTQQIKPDRPKECFDAAIRQARVQRSSALFRRLAEQVSLSRCQDPCFTALRAILTEWFPAPTPGSAPAHAPGDRG